MANRNNKPCYCGSGKKYKKCCKNKKPRETVVEGSFDNPVTSNNFRLNLKNGRVGFYLDSKANDELSSYIATLRHDKDGGKGHKVISRVYSKGGDIRAFVDTNLLKFNYVVAVDTNEKKIGEDRVCVSVAMVASPSAVPGKVLLTVIKNEGHVIEFWNPVERSERVGWKIAIEVIVGTSAYLNGGTFGVIVDSELDSLNLFNSRELEITPGFTLPERITMIYGSADKKNDSAINKFINLADKTANSVFEDIQLKGFNRSRVSSSDLYTDEFHWVNVKIPV